MKHILILIITVALALISMAKYMDTKDPEDRRPGKWAQALRKWKSVRGIPDD